jgi:hypothetical protein
MIKTPLVSFLVTARNDGYMGDFLWRLETTLNCLARSAQALGRLDDFECVVCDWGSEHPLHQAVRVSPEAQRITKFVVVPPSVAIQYQADSKFPDPIAFNVAARRATGSFLGTTGSDVLYLAPSLNCMAGVLEGKYPGVDPARAVLTAGRRHVPVHVVRRQLPLNAFLDYVSRNATYFPSEVTRLGTAAPSNLILLHRDIWHACHGTDQRLIHWGWTDTNLVLRGCQQYPLVDLDHYGVNLLHLEHWTKPRDYDAQTMHRQKNKADDAPAFVANDANWGLADLNLEVHCAGQIASPEAAAAPPPEIVSIQQVVEEANSQPVLDLVNLMLNNSQGLVPQREYGALQMLAWYASTRGPMNFVEVGMRYPFVAGLVSRACPGVELYPLVWWQRNQADEHFFHADPESCLTYWANNFLRTFSQHWAYTQFIGGDFSTALSRLRNLRTGRFHLDLALLRDSPLAPGQGLELASMLNPGGAIVLLANDPASYQAIVGPLQQQHPKFTYLNMNDGISGMVIAQQLQ